MEVTVAGDDEFLPNLKIELVQYTEDPEVALSEIAACSHFIATRFHSAVFAYVGQCRMLIVEYHRKLTDFADEIGLSRDFVITNEEVTDKAIVQRKIQGLLSSEAGQKLLPVKDARALAERNFSFFRGNV